MKNIFAVIDGHCINVSKVVVIKDYLKVKDILY